jgi:hypothetical protein
VRAALGLDRWVRAEAEGCALLLLVGRERALKLCKLQRCRLRAVQDRFDDVGRQQGEPDVLRIGGRGGTDAQQANDPPNQSTA